MKKLFLLSAFMLGVFAVSQAQITGTFKNTTTLNWSYSLTDNGSTDGLVVAPGSVGHVFIDAIDVPCTWRASPGPGCTVNGTLTVGGPTTVAVNCTLQATYITYEVIDLGGGKYDLTVSFHY